jgi:hypothetical protein
MRRHDVHCEVEGRQARLSGEKYSLEWSTYFMMLSGEDRAWRLLLDASRVRL